MKKVVLTLSVLLSCGLFCACSSDGDNFVNDGSFENEKSEESPQMNNVEELVDNIMNLNLPYKQIALDDMPSWLADMVSESIENSKTFPTCSWYYQFKWNESAYYLIRGIYSPSLFNVLYNSQGERIELSQNEEDNCLAWSSDWCIIYEVQSESYK